MKSNCGLRISCVVSSLRNDWPFTATNCAVKRIMSMSNPERIVGGSRRNLNLSFPSNDVEYCDEAEFLLKWETAN